MSDWEMVPAGAVTTQRKDVIVLEPGVEYRTMGVRWYGKGAYDRGAGSTETIKAKRLFRAHGGDFVFNRIDTQNGAFDVVSDALDGSLATNEFPLYRADSERLVAAFLHLYFQQASVLAQIGAMRAGSEGRSRWKEADFEAWPVPLPSVPEQHRIVGVMAAVDAQIGALGDGVKAAERAYVSFLNNLTESHPSQKIEAVVRSASAGGTPSRARPDFYGGVIPWLKSGEVQNDNITSAAEFITEAGLKGSSAKLVPAGATVIAMYGQGDTKGKAGYVALPVTTNQALLALIPNEAVVTPRFLLHAVRSQTVALRSRAIGAAQPNLNKGLVLSHEIPVPADLDVQRSDADAADALCGSREQQRDELVRLRMFRTVLLTSLLTQDIEIPESYDDLLEAAS